MSDAGSEASSSQATAAALLREASLDVPSPSISPNHTPPMSPSIRRRHQFFQASQDEAFRCEDGTNCDLVTDRRIFMSGVLLENPETETRWYFKYFLGQAHSNYATVLTRDKERERVVISVLHPLPAQDEVRAILWRQSGSEHIALPTHAVYPKGKTPDLKKVLVAMDRGVPDKTIAFLEDADVQSRLLTLEEQEGAVNFKIGILYAKKGQQSDDEMFSNERASPAFRKFYESMGNVINLQNYVGFRGGLDVKSGSTGEMSVSTHVSGKEIMFHVSTLLPYSTENRQQLERKRHLGNDICNIVFQEDHQTEFIPALIKSQFNHIFAVVSLQPDESYVLKVYTKTTVPEYGPELPNPARFTDLAELRKFLLVKLLNGEKAALDSPSTSFAKRRERTLQSLIKDIHSLVFKVKDDMASLTRQKKRFSTREKYNVDELRAHGQSIKIEKIAASVAPTSRLGEPGDSAEQAQEPWTSHEITSLEEHIVFCAAQFDEYLILATDHGLIRVEIRPHEKGKLPRIQLTEPSFHVRQLVIDESINLVFARVAKGALYAIPLGEFLGIQGEPLGKKTLKQYALPACKGLHLFSINMGMSTTTASRLKLTCKLAIAVGKKLKTFQYIVPGAGLIGQWSLIEEYMCADHIECMAVGRGMPGSSSPGLVCLGLKCGEFQVIDLQSSSVTVVMSSEDTAGTMEPFDCQEIIEGETDEVMEFMLGYNRSTVFRDACGEATRPFDIHWRSRPHGLAYCYPYLLAFTEVAVQVSTLINGNLVRTLELPGVKFLTSKRDVVFTSTSKEGGKTVTKLLVISRSALTGKTRVKSQGDLSFTGTAPTRKLSMSTFDSPQASRKTSGTSLGAITE
eukprot:m.16827 g.16827  ORF g.16827 m.16827 type:complete len:854 (-) comp7242_c0_seq2:198-2759(-)